MAFWTVERLKSGTWATMNWSRRVPSSLRPTARSSRRGGSGAGRASSGRDVGTDMRDLGARPAPRRDPGARLFPRVPVAGVNAKLAVNILPVGEVLPHLVVEFLDVLVIGLVLQLFDALAGFG